MAETRPEPPDTGSGEKARARAPREALEAFLAATAHRAYRFARCSALDHDAALDAVQESMLKLVEHYARRPEEEWPALFFTILRNAIHDVQRWRLRWSWPFAAARREEDSGPEAAAVDTSSSAEARYAAGRQRAALERAIRGLPLRQRQTFLLREWQGFSIEETARILGCSEGSVKQHHFRALQALRSKLSEVWHDNA
jgi:RNA polymerase sigma-70 factor (ECF subfamily)